jgi:hypothetical protein
LALTASSGPFNAGPAAITATVRGSFWCGAGHGGLGSGDLGSYGRVGRVRGQAGGVGNR